MYSVNHATAPMAVDQTAATSFLQATAVLAYPSGENTARYYVVWPLNHIALFSPSLFLPLTSGTAVIIKRHYGGRCSATARAGVKAAG